MEVVLQELCSVQVVLSSIMFYCSSNVKVCVSIEVFVHIVSSIMFLDCSIEVVLQVLVSVQVVLSSSMFYCSNISSVVFLLKYCSSIKCCVSMEEKYQMLCF